MVLIIVSGQWGKSFPIQNHQMTRKSKIYTLFVINSKSVKNIITFDSDIEETDWSTINKNGKSL